MNAARSTPPAVPPATTPRPLRIAGALAVVAVLAAATMPIARADPSPAAQAEIDHLLAFVAGSPCTFIRNGEPHPGPEARDHLASKFGYAKSRIATADDFIRYLATESSLSHQPYRVKCGATEMPAGLWLTDELRRFRATAGKPAR